MSTSDALFAAELTERLIGDISGKFFIPDYQRGYRWGASEVQHLLDDVRESSGSNYYLQPVVVKRIAPDRWELVDGQQRLTTLYLILQFISKKYLPAARAGYSLEYETRPNSAVYLEILDPALADNNIDFFHIFSAYQVIEHWFESQSNPLQAAIDFYTSTTKFLRVIWYEAADDVDAKELFRRLNVGRIPLTDAELVKALVLARMRDEFPESGRAHEVAAQWDVIERSLRNPEVWAFISGKTLGEATHIRLLLDALADQLAPRPIGFRPLFHTFETLRPQIEADANAVWNTIQDLHSLLIGWYDDRATFHLIGYLIATGETFASISELAGNRTRSAFRAALIELIRVRLNLTAAQAQQMTYPSPKCTQLLLLMNVEATHPSQRYSFERHSAVGWSLEHIHAQNAESLTRADQWRAWLKDHIEAVRSVNSTLPERSLLIADAEEALNANPLTEVAFRALESRIVAIFDPKDLEEQTHTISNLALLATRDNSVLNNSVFAVKREAMLSLDRSGAYIPPCTRNVFLKYYTPTEEQQLHIWGHSDRTHYMNEILRLTGPYLTSSEACE